MADENTAVANDGPSADPLTESIGMEEFAAGMEDMPDDVDSSGVPPQPKPKEGDEGYQPDTGNAQEEGAEVPADTDENGEAKEEPVDAAGADDAPQYWSAEDKAEWAKVPAELKPLLQKYDHQREAYAQEKAREAAEIRQKAQAEVKQYSDKIAEAATWWEQKGPDFVKAFGDKWATINWIELADKNPAECQRLREMQRSEYEMLQQVNQRAAFDAQIKQKRDAEEFQEARRTEHAKVAAKLPDYFGTPELSAKTYDKLGNYLYSQGIPADRINSIHEAPIIEIALKAMRFDEAQKKASAVVNRDPASGKFTATATPVRVAPGPAQKPGSRVSDADRQAAARFRSTGEVADLAKVWDSLP